MHKILKVFIIVTLTIIEFTKCEWRIKVNETLKVPPGFFIFDAKANDSLKVTAQFGSPTDIDMELYKQGTSLYYAAIKRAKSYDSLQILQYTIRQTSRYYIKAYAYTDQGVTLTLLQKYNLTIQINNSTVAFYPNVVATSYMQRMQTARLEVGNTDGCNYMVELGGVLNAFQNMAILYDNDSATYPPNLPVEYSIVSPSFPFNSSLYLRKRGTYYVGIAQTATDDLLSIATITLKVYQDHNPKFRYNLILDVCQPNCLLFPNAYPSQSNMLSCNCISHYVWIPDQFVCLPLCGVLPYSFTDSLYENKCRCRDGFKWDTNKCIVDCTLIQNALEIQKNSISKCMCENGYIWSDLSIMCIEDMHKKYSQLIVFVIILSCILILPLSILIFLLCKVNKLENQLHVPLEGQEQSVDHKKHQKKNKSSKLTKSTLQKSQFRFDNRKRNINQNRNTHKQVKASLNQEKKQKSSNKYPQKFKEEDKNQKLKQNMKTNKNRKQSQTNNADSSFTKMTKGKIEDDSVSYESYQ